MTMDELRHILHLPVEFVWGCVAVCGGVARYLVSFRDGQVNFSFALLLASAFIAGFSGYMFALLGRSWGMPGDVDYIFAGVGGFFGEQTLKLIYEYAWRKNPDQK